MQHLMTIDDELYCVWLGRARMGYALHMQNSVWPVALEGASTLLFDGERHCVTIAVDGDRVYVHLDGTAHELVLHDPIAFHVADAAGPAQDSVRAPMPGSVIATPVAAGETVAAGDTLIVIESMKLETAVKAPRDGIVEAVNFMVGQNFERDAVLATLVRSEE